MQDNQLPPARRVSRVKVIRVTPQQVGDAELMAFAILISGRVETPAQAYDLSLHLVKLRDRARMHVRKLAKYATHPTPALARRIRTIRTHLDAITGRLVELHGTRELSINTGANGAVSLVYGNTSLLLGA